MTSRLEDTALGESIRSSFFSLLGQTLAMYVALTILKLVTILLLQLPEYLYSL